MKYPRLEVVALIAIFILIMISGSPAIYADGQRHSHNQTSTQKHAVEASNLAAGRLDFDWYTQNTQISGAWGTDNSKALGAGKRFGDTLFTGTATKDSKGDVEGIFSFTRRLK